MIQCNNKQPLIIGHRGVRAHEPENTLRSFRRAIELGCDGVELDVHICKSGEIMVIHDDKVDRTTGGKGLVSELTLKELKKLDAGKGQKIPTLDEVLEITGKDKIVFIEIKNPQDSGNIADFITSKVKSGYDYSNLPVISFYPEALKTIKNRDGNILTGTNFSSFNEDKEGGRFQFNHDNWKDFVKDIIKDLHLYSINPCIADLHEDMAKFAHENDTKIFTWTVNKDEEIRKALKSGVNGIISDDPAKFIEYLKNHE